MGVGVPGSLGMDAAGVEIHVLEIISFWQSKQYTFFLIYSFCIILLMGHGVGYYIGLNEIGSPSPIKTFITINYLFNFIFGFIR